MIENIDLIKQDLKNKMSKEIDNFVDKMEIGFKGTSFSIDEIEKLWGDAINGCNTVLQNGTQKILDSVNERELISKKKRNRL